MVEPGNAPQFARAVFSLYRNRSQRDALVEAGLKHIENFRVSALGAVFLKTLEGIVSSE